MHVYDATVSDVPVLRISGSLADPHGFKEFQGLVRSYLAQRCSRLVLELQEVPRLDARGLTTLLAVLTHAGTNTHVARLAQVGCDALPIPRTLVVEFDHFD